MTYIMGHQLVGNDSVQVDVSQQKIFSFSFFFSFFSMCWTSLIIILMRVNNENQISWNSLQIVVCMCPKKNLSFLLASQNHGHGYTNLGKVSGFLLPNLSTKKARRINGGNFFGGCLKAPIFSSKTSKIAKVIEVNWRDVVVLN